MWKSGLFLAHLFSSQTIFNLQQLLMIMPQYTSSLSFLFHSRCCFICPSCGAEHHTLVISPRGGIQTLLPTASGINVTKKNTAQSSTGWNDALLTHRRDRARSASTAGSSPSWLVGTPTAYAGQLAYMHPSRTTGEGPQILSCGI